MIKITKGDLFIGFKFYNCSIERDEKYLLEIININNNDVLMKDERYSPLSIKFIVEHLNEGILLEKHTERKIKLKRLLNENN